MRLTPLILALFLAAGPAGATEQRVSVFDDVVMQWIEDLPEIQEEDGYVVRHKGQTVERAIALPPAPATAATTQRIVATIFVHPVVSTVGRQRRPNDPWTRLGNISVLAPGADGRPEETELVRFATSYGGASEFEQDVTAFAPLLHGTRTLRVFIATYSDEPGWTISVGLRYAPEGVGPRRPALARQLFSDPHVTATSPKLAATIDVPAGLDPPRLRILSTGHATDGLAGNEFVSCTHILRIDGREIARWRPWSETGGSLRRDNPWAGRRTIDGRELWASDFDRSGWNPGRAVIPLLLPVPELSPGPHRIELEILGIRPKSPPTPPRGMEHHGYWVVSVTVVADEPWPEE